MIGFLSFFFKYYKCITHNILHNHWPGCTFLQIFLRNYRQVQILPGPTNRTRDLVLPTACVTILTEYQTHSHNDSEILINALWHTSPSANNRHTKCHTIIFSYNILAIHPTPSHKKKYDMNDIWFKNDNNWNHFNNYTRKKIHSNIHLPRAINLSMSFRRSWS